MKSEAVPTVSNGTTNRLINIKVGPIPLPLYLIMAAIIYVASVYGKLPADMIGGIAVMMVMGILLGDIGMPGTRTEGHWRPSNFIYFHSFYHGLLQFD